MSTGLRRLCPPHSGVETVRLFPGPWPDTVGSVGKGGGLAIHSIALAYGQGRCWGRPGRWPSLILHREPWLSQTWGCRHWACLPAIPRAGPRCCVVRASGIGAPDGRLQLRVCPVLFRALAPGGLLSLVLCWPQGDSPTAALPCAQPASVPHWTQPQTHPVPAPWCCPRQ